MAFVMFEERDGFTIIYRRMTNLNPNDLSMLYEDLI